MNDIVRMVGDSAERIFSGQITAAVRAAFERGEWCADLWRAVDGAGLLDALGDEATTPYAQLDAGAAVLRAAGAYAVPLPVGETMIGRWLIRSVGLACPDGALALAPANFDTTISATRRRDSLVLKGSERLAPWGSSAAQIVAVAATPDGPCVCQVSRETVKSFAGRNLAGEPNATIEFEGAEVPAGSWALLAPSLSAEAGLELAALARTVMMAGALERVLELAVDYAGSRQQFGRPIAKFQAVQQNLAVLAAEVAVSNAVSDAAVAELRESNSRTLTLAANARVRDAADVVARIAHQVHGAIGFTHEHMLHHYTRRLWAWRDEYGGLAVWSQRLGRAALAADGEGLWSTLTAV